MNYRDGPNPTRDGVRWAAAPATSVANGRTHRDPVLGTVALGALLLIVAWVVTGFDVLAIVALVVALGYVLAAGARNAVAASSSAGVLPRKREAIADARAIDARLRGLGSVRVTGDRDGDMPRKGSRNGPSARSRRRSAYDGLAD